MNLLRSVSTLLMLLAFLGIVRVAHTTATERGQYRVNSRDFTWVPGSTRRQVESYAGLISVRERQYHKDWIKADGNATLFFWYFPAQSKVYGKAPLVV